MTIQEALLIGSYDYYSKHFNIIANYTDLGVVKQSVIINGEVVEAVISTSGNNAYDNLELLKEKYILNHHHKCAGKLLHVTTSS